MASLVPAVRRRLGEAGRAPSYELHTLAVQVDESLTRERLLATLSGFFGGLALLLAGIGLYGTVAYGVARRRHEIAIRLTLGAVRARVLRMVLGEVGCDWWGSASPSASSSPSPPRAGWPPSSSA